MIKLSNLLSELYDVPLHTVIGDPRISAFKPMEETAPCWDGYTQYGMKEKDGKQVPNCVPVEEELKLNNSNLHEILNELEFNEDILNEGAGFAVWGMAIGNLVSQGVLTPTQGAIIMIGTPIALATGFGLAVANSTNSYVNRVKGFVRDVKEKRKINPKQVDKLISDTTTAIKDMSPGTQRYAIKLMKQNKAALVSGDKNAMLQAQRKLKTYVNQKIDTQNYKDKIDHVTTAPGNRPKTTNDTEKRIAPTGAVHAGFGRWTDTSGKTLGYTRDGKWVPAKPNITENESIDEINEYCTACLIEYIQEHDNVLEEAEYHGHKVSLGKPGRGDVKKFKVFVKDPKTGNVKKVNFGDKTMRIKKSIPSHRKSFRARHHCDTNPGPRTKARYWSCRKW
jgi:hypothetical protein